MTSFNISLTRSLSFFQLLVKSIFSQDDPSQVIEEINHKIRQLREESSIQRQNKSGLENEVKDIRTQYNTEKKKQQAIKRKLENVRNRIIELDNVEEVLNFPNPPII